MGRAVAASIALVILAISYAAAWDCPGGVTGADSVAGTSSFFGIKQDKPLKYLDHVPAWKKFGSITKINTYYSYNYGCVQGVKVTYGYDARNAQMLGIEKGLTEKHIILVPHENVVRVEIKQNPTSKCIEYVKLTTNQGKTLAVGNMASSSPSQVAAPAQKDGFLAAFRGYEDYYAGQPVTKGGLQQLQLVWGVAVCPTPAPAPVPAAEPAPEPAQESPEPLETPAPEPAPADEPAPVPAVDPVPEPVPEPEPEALCPADTTKCDAAATTGSAVCPAIAPFLSPQCAGGCCVSSGKCRKGFCSQAGLGAEVMGAHMFCWGTNSGPINHINSCRNLACKLAVPGCISDLISGSCVGTVVALTNDVDDGMRKWVGYPCLQTVPGGVPIDALGKMDVHGPYAAKLWSICNCQATKMQPGYNSTTCKGPLCALFKHPELPSLNFAHSNFTLPDVGPIIELDNYDFSQIYQLFHHGITLPKVKVQIPDLHKHMSEIATSLNTSVEVLNPIISALFTQAGYPTFAVSIQRPEMPVISVNPPQHNFQLNETVPTFDFSELQKMGSKAMNATAGIDLGQLLSALKAHLAKVNVTSTSTVTGPAGAGAVAAPALPVPVAAAAEP